LIVGASNVGQDVGQSNAPGQFGRHGWIGQLAGQFKPPGQFAGHDTGVILCVSIDDCTGS